MGVKKAFLFMGRSLAKALPVLPDFLGRKGEMDRAAFLPPGVGFSERGLGADLS